jgi:hypothetical protein
LNNFASKNWQRNWRFGQNWCLSVHKWHHNITKNVDSFTENWQKSLKIGKNGRKLAKMAENWQKWPNIGKNL